MKNKVKAACRLVLAVVAAVVVLAGGYGCSLRHLYFNTTEKDAVVKPGTLAVLSADNAAVSMTLARLLTRELQTRTTFRVVSQEEIVKRIPDYPAPVLDTNAIQKNLKADYLFVLRGQNLRKVLRTTQFGHLLGVGRGSFEADIIGQLFRYPEGAEVGTTFFTAREDAGFIMARESEKDNEHVDKMIQSAATFITDDFLAITKAGRPSK